MQVFLWTYVFVSLWSTRRSGIAGRRVTVVNLLRNPRSFRTKSQPPFLAFYLRSPLLSRPGHSVPY